VLRTARCPKRGSRSQISVTAFGLIFTPVFYVISRWLAALRLNKIAGTTLALSTPAE
jgi:hypothetical protein